MTLLQPTFGPSETVASVVWRLSYFEGVDPVEILMGQFGFVDRDIQVLRLMLPDRALAARLQPWGYTASNSLHPYIGRAFEPGMATKGGQLIGHQIRTYGAALCPACHETTPGVWQTDMALPFVVVCPRDGVIVLDGCSCDVVVGPFSHGRRSSPSTLADCGRCGRALASIPYVEADSDLIAAQRTVLETFTGPSADTTLQMDLLTTSLRIQVAKSNRRWPPRAAIARHLVAAVEMTLASTPEPGDEELTRRLLAGNHQVRAAHVLRVTGAQDQRRSTREVSRDAVAPPRSETTVAT